MTLHSTKLGDILVNSRQITAKARDKALHIAQILHVPLGQVLLKEGECNSLQLHQTIALQKQMEFANLLTTPPHPSLLQIPDLVHYIALELVPWRYDVDSETMLIASINQADAQHEWAKKEYSHYRFVQTSPLDIQRSLSAHFSKSLIHQATYKLATNTPKLSAKTLVKDTKNAPFYLLITVFLLAFLFAPEFVIITILLIINSFHLVTLLFKTVLFSAGTTKRSAVWNRHAEYPPLADIALPSFCILVPLYREVAIVKTLITRLNDLDYPAAKLDIKLIVEEDDHETYEAICDAKPNAKFTIAKVPPSQPRTKPKACNYALHFATSDIVSIYDAEDAPHPQQLREVAHRFHYASNKVVSIQCRLNYYNRNQNLLTRLFSIEYGVWFDLMLPALRAYRFPIPLGGTSNHIKRALLVDVGEWDPFNVTEDADLGIRLAALGYETDVIQSQTLEEAPIHFLCWMKQRSRWIKGYMQTYLLHMRQPLTLYRQLGCKGFVAFQLFIGGPSIVFLTTPFLLIFSGLWLIKQPVWVSAPAQWVLPLSITMLLYGVILHYCFAVSVIKTRHWKGMFGCSILFPFYWLLHSVASFKAVYQLLTRPHYWEKTDHGHSINPHKE